MTQKVIVCTSSAFLALVIRKTLARSRHLGLLADARGASATAAALGEPGILAIVDVELLHDAAEGKALRAALVKQRAASIVIDARGRGVPDDVDKARNVTVVRGRLGGELDLGVVEAELLAAVGSALRGGSGGSEKRPVERIPLPPVERDEASPLELIVLGVSTGGPTVLLALLRDVTAPAIPMLIVQHMPETETAGFAARLGEESGLDVREVAAGPVPPPGTIGVLRGGVDYAVVRRGGALHLRLASVPHNPFHPSVDEILLSAVAAGVTVGAAILTGMGQDGAAGALAAAQKGLPIIAQRPDTCAVAGMPQAAIDNGAARWVQSPEGIAHMLNRWNDVARKGAPSGQARQSS